MDGLLEEHLVFSKITISNPFEWIWDSVVKWLMNSDRGFEVQVQPRSALYDKMYDNDDDMVYHLIATGGCKGRCGLA